MLSKIVLWFVLIAPWISLLFLKKEVVKRYMPVAIFTSLLLILYNIIAYNQKHWIIKVTIIPVLKPIFVSGVLGSFIGITIWIFHYTYGKFWLYLLTNIILDFMFAIFPIHYIFQEKLEIYKLVNTNPWWRFIFFVTIAVIIYGYQVWQEDRNYKANAT